jgi:hypothetical protein
VWNDAFFPELGQRIIVRSNNRMLGQGVVAAYRETAQGWEFRLQEHPRIWFAQALLHPNENPSA